METNVDVSIVIVSMNNPADLNRCVESVLAKNKTINLEILIVLFNFSQDNLEKIRHLPEACRLFYSNGIRGFSANNNIALKEAKGEYILILNDDTYFDDDSLEQMYFKSKEKGLMLSSPVLIHFDNRIQFFGRPKFHIVSVILHEFKLQKYLRYIHKDHGDYFETYNISGACFLIKRDYFKSMGWFDEDYFFTPEDIAVGTISRIKNGVYPVVFKNLRVFHKGSSTARSILATTIPTAKQGIYIMFRKIYGYRSEFLIRGLLLPVFLFKYCFWLIRSGDKNKQLIMLKSFSRCIKYSFLSRNTMDLFTKLYKQ